MGGGGLRSVFSNQSEGVGLYCRAKTSDIEVLTGNIKRSIPSDEWIRSQVSQVYVHESYMPDEVYNDVAVLKVRKNYLRRNSLQIFGTYILTVADWVKNTGYQEKKGPAHNYKAII
jgi:secreted trypsin-like serine protease